MAVRIVGVHGVGNHLPQLPEAEASRHLAGRWAEAVMEGLGGAPGTVDLAMAYYAPCLLPAGDQGPVDDLGQLPPEVIELARAWVEQVVGPELVGTVQARWSVALRGLLATFARREGLSETLLRRLVAVFLREVWTYLRWPDSVARVRARQVVAETIRRHRPQVLIAHSLGSVVAYETLHAFPDLSVDLFVTIGSPLGLPGLVFHRLQPQPYHDDLGLRPMTIGYWVNVADPGDIVAIPRRLGDCFSPDEDHQDVHIHWLDFHSALRYLRSRPVLDALRPVLAAADRPRR
jgi:hypothetical protein